MEWCDLQLSDVFQFSECSGNDSWSYLHLPNDANNCLNMLLPGNAPLDRDGPLKAGFLHNGSSWAWLCRAGATGIGGTLLQIVCLRNGRVFLNYDFKNILPSNQNYFIGFVEELSALDHSTRFANAGTIVMNGLRNSFLAVILQAGSQNWEDEGQSSDPENECDFLCIYSIRLNVVLSIIQLPWTVNCLRVLKPLITSCHPLLRNFDGCLAIGTDNGYLSLLNLRLNQLQITDLYSGNRLSITKCVVADHELQSSEEIVRRFSHAQQENLNFLLQIDVSDQTCGIQCVLPIYPAMTLSVGLQDGRLVCYDLSNLQVYYIATPPARIGPCSLVKMDYLEPSDDPRVLFYICSMHHNGEVLYAFLYSFMFKQPSVIVTPENRSDEILSFRGNFQTAMLCLQMPLEANRCIPLRCQAICTTSPQNEDESYCLCALSWFSILEKRNKLLLFDLNQWYKDQMPVLVASNKPLNYLAGYICMESTINQGNTLPFGGIFDSWVNTDSIAYFHSVLRLEEHFYPNSLSFDFSLLHLNGNNIYNWEGAQNKIINIMRNSDANIFLDVDPYINELIHSRLIPMFMDDIDWNDIESISQNCKYEILMATALEQNCMNLLRDCAKSWMDGSFMGRPPFNLSLSLSVLTDWIVKQATSIKQRCNLLCKGLFEIGGHSLDHREQNEFAFITHQLKLLSNLLEYILEIAQKYIPEQVFSNLKLLQVNLKMAKNYQEVILWLTNIGLLPQGQLQCSTYARQLSRTSVVRHMISNENKEMMSYPYVEMKDFYNSKRANFQKINSNFIDKKSGSCRLLYIDAFLDHVCSDTKLSAQWEECGETCLYPPISIEAMLRVFLLSKLDFEQQCSLLWYFLLDLKLFLNNDAYRDVHNNVLKFPSVFKLSTALTKTVQSAWNLDHDYLMLSVDDFTSPLNKNNNYPQWLIEIIIQVLLIQNEANLALRVMASHSNLVTPILKLYTMLDNNLLAEAFHFVRSTDNINLLQVYFKCCLQRGEFGVIRDLALNEHEGNVLQDILKQNTMPGSQSLHFVYLLQRFKYLEAVSYMDELAKSKRATGCSSITSSNNMINSSNVMDRLSQMDTPNMMLSAYNLTMTPITQGLTDVYLKIRNKIKQKEINQKNPVPLSCQLIKQNANDLLGGIYHSSALSAHFATYYRSEMNERIGDVSQKDANRQQNVQQVMNCNNAPFLRRPQTFGSICDQKQNISYPTVYNVTEKRSHPDRENGPGKLKDEWTYPGLDSPSLPMKRRRLIPENSQEIKDILRDLASANLTEAFKDNADNETGLPYANIEFLRQPVVCVKPNVLSTDDIDMQNENESVDLPGILKANSDSRVETTNNDERRKSIRFTLPDKISKKSIEPSQLGIKNSDFTIPLNKSVLTEEALQRFNKADEHCQSRKKTTNILQELSSEDDSQSSKIVCPNLSEHELSLSPSSKNICSSAKNGNYTKELQCRENARLSTASFPMPRKPLHNITEISDEYISSHNIIEQKVINASSEDNNKQSSITYVKPEVCEDTLMETLENTTTKEIDKGRTCPIAIAPTVTMEEDLNDEVAMTTVPCSSVGEFAPPISSSKVGINIQNYSNTKEVKMSECSTVVGTWTNIIDTADTVSGVTDGISAMPSESLVLLPSNYEDQPIPEEKSRLHMLQTTLSMSTFDVSTSVVQSPSSEQVTDSAVSSILDKDQIICDLNRSTTLKSEVQSSSTEQITESSVSSTLNRDRIRKDLNISTTPTIIESRFNSLPEETTLNGANDCISLSSSTTNITSTNSERSEQMFGRNAVDTDGDADDEADELLIIEEEEEEKEIDEETTEVEKRTTFTNNEEQDETLAYIDNNNTEDELSENNSRVRNTINHLVKISADDDNTNSTYENSGSNVDDQVSVVNLGSEVHSYEDYTLETQLSQLTDNGNINSTKQIFSNTHNRLRCGSSNISDIIEITDNSLNDSNGYVIESSNGSSTYNIDSMDKSKNVSSQRRDFASENDFKDQMEIEKKDTELNTSDDKIAATNEENPADNFKKKTICQIIESRPVVVKTDENQEVSSVVSNNDISLEFEPEEYQNNYNEIMKQSTSKTTIISNANLDFTEYNTSELIIPASEKKTSIILSVDITDGVNEVESRKTKAVNKELVSDLGLFLTESNYQTTEDSRDDNKKSKEDIVLNRLNIRGTSEPLVELSPYSLRNRRSTSVPVDRAPTNREEFNENATSKNKISKHRSVTLDVIAESSPIIDSPSSRTRSRLRLSSVDKELDSPLFIKNNTPDGVKRKRTFSNSSENQINKKEKSKSLEPLPTTPKRGTRGKSVGPMSEDQATSSRHTKKIQMPTVIEEEQDDKKITQRKKGTKVLVYENLSIQSNISKEDIAEESYRTTRRLTRNQMTIMKKSENLLKKKNRNDLEEGLASTSKKSSIPQSDLSNTEIKDDTLSQTSSGRTRKGSISTTNSSVSKKTKKELNQVDEDAIDIDDSASVASSLESRSSTRSRSRKDTKTNRDLTQLPENSPKESRKQRTRLRKQ